jgi:hypothetical protein
MGLLFGIVAQKMRNLRMRTHDMPEHAIVAAVPATRLRNRRGEAGVR